MTIDFLQTFLLRRVKYIFNRQRTLYRKIFCYFISLIYDVYALIVLQVFCFNQRVIIVLGNLPLLYLP